MKKALYDLVYFTACGLNGIIPEEKRIAEADKEKLRKAAKIHGMSALVAEVLLSAGAEISSEWQEAKDKALRKVLLLDGERAKIFARFEAAGIWYLPLKGILTKELYPKAGMREMSDNDILFDRTKQAEVKKIMTELGYRTESMDSGHHDVYMKAPVYNFELHRDLVTEFHDVRLADYYSGIEDLLITTEGKSFERRLSIDDNYVYNVVHEYKHSIEAGIGLRALADRYVYLTKYRGELDTEYIKTVCEKLGIGEFEEEGRLLEEKIFSSPNMPKLSEAETALLERYLFCGLYGTNDRWAENSLKNISVWKILRIAFTLRTG